MALRKKSEVRRTVRATENPGQFWIEGTSPGETFEDRYVEFSGYFGSHGPHVFAAAPELLQALRVLVAYCEPNADPEIFPEEAERLRVARAAIAKAEGCTDA